MKKVALLQGVTPVGQNRIPKMAYLAEILTEAGLENVKTYIQSGNSVFETTLSDDICALIHDTIQAKIGADLSVILKTQAQFTTDFAESPFDESYDDSRVYLVFTNDQLDQEILNELLEIDFGAEILKAGNECLYLLEKQLHITATVRKPRSILRLSQM